MFIAQQHASLRVCEASLLRILRCVLNEHGRSVASLGIVLTDREVMQALNRQFRGGDYETDVLAFPLGGTEVIDAEVYVNMDFAAEHCAAHGARFEQEVQRYVIHGVLHLCGFDDSDEAGRARMRREEDRFLV